MNTTAADVASAATFLWLGMVLAISFLEAPLKFRAPGVSLRLGLGIGRLVFRALNRAEIVLAVVVLGAVFIGGAAPGVWVVSVVAAGLLAVQLAAIRPLLNRRTDQVLAGHDGPRSQAHLIYIAVEVVKVVTLVVLGVTVLAL